MNSSALREAQALARDCALTMMENAGYILKELPDVELDDALRKRTGEVCNGLVGTKHDVIHEVFELDGLLESKAPEADLRARLDLIVKMLHEDVTRLHGLVKSLEAAGQRNPRYQMAFVLVAESATNILNAYNPFRTAVDPLRAGPGGPLSGPCCPPG